ncbi:Mur ligase family protein, partial [Poseidonibacter sp.]|uniref:Mur ligase family protein n=1 Tax=Poseidonibacter sp. TaxID=2321188 RepID=UPI003C7656B4
MILSVNDIARVTNGQWKNIPDNFNIKGINFTEKDLQQGDLFVTRSTEEYKELKEGNENLIDKIIKKKPAALIVRKTLKEIDFPCLVVENTKVAFKNIAIATRDRSNAKKVLVTGSYGKTGFKIRLNQLIKDNIRTKIIENSANEDSGVYKALSSLSKDDEVTIIEAGGSTLSRATRRSEAVKPDICVITSIGHEDIYQHKTINNTIYNKSSITKYLNENGICIIKKDKYYEKMCKSILEHNSNTIIKSVGESICCNAFIIEKKFNDYGWDIKASIEGEIIVYRIPFIDLHSVEASLLEFLTAKYLGVDLNKISSQYNNIKNFYTSGKFYNIEIGQKDFLFYDQSHRGGIENYESFFKTIRYIKPENNGRKILFTSAFVDHEDNEMDNINPNIFKSLIKDAGFDAIFTTEYFSNHMEVLADKNIWKKHKFDYKDLRDDVLRYINSDDILFVKGIFGSKLRNLLPYIKSFPTSKVSDYLKKDDISNIGKKINLEDIKLFKSKLKKTNNLAWCYYFPFLVFFSKSKTNELYIEEINGSLVVYFLRNAHKNNPILELFFPPLP